MATQTVAAVVAVVVTLVFALWMVSLRPSRTPAPAPRAPITTERTCTYQYLDCDSTTTTGWPG